MLEGVRQGCPSCLSSSGIASLSIPQVLRSEDRIRGSLSCLGASHCQTKGTTKDGVGSDTESTSLESGNISWGSLDLKQG